VTKKGEANHRAFVDSGVSFAHGLVAKPRARKPV
jgi:hypothetical protein